jgi:hypothetical protein
MANYMGMGYFESDVRIIALLLSLMAIILGANIYFLHFARYLTTSRSLPQNQEQDEETLRSHARDVSGYEMICIKRGEKALVGMVLQKLHRQGFLKKINVQD